MLGATIIKIPHLLFACYIDLQNNLGFKSWYPIKLGSINVSDVSRHPPNQTSRQIKLPYFIVSNEAKATCFQPMKSFKIYNLDLSWRESLEFQRPTNFSWMIIVFRTFCFFKIMYILLCIHSFINKASTVWKNKIVIKLYYRPRFNFLKSKINRLIFLKTDFTANWFWKIVDCKTL